MARTKQTFRKAQAQRALKVGTQSHETTLVPATQSAELPAAAAAMPPHAKKERSPVQSQDVYQASRINSPLASFMLSLIFF